MPVAADVELGSIAELAAAIFAGAALIVALLGWRSANEAAAEQRVTLDKQNQWIDAQLTALGHRAAVEATRVRFDAYEDTIHPDGHIEVDGQFPKLRIFNGSNAMIRQLRVDVGSGSGFDEIDLASGEIRVFDLYEPKKWSAFFQDVAGDTWYCSHVDAIPFRRDSDDLT